MYVLLFKHPEHDWILETSPDNQIAAYETFGEVIAKFSGYIRGWTSPSWGGATMSMMNVQPKAVEMFEPAETIGHFLIDTGIVKLTAFGMNGEVRGARIKESFMENKKVVDIWKETMIRAGIYDPTKSDLVGVQKELEF